MCVHDFFYIGLPVANNGSDDDCDSPVPGRVSRPSLEKTVERDLEDILLLLLVILPSSLFHGPVLDAFFPAKLSVLP